MDVADNLWLAHPHASRDGGGNFKSNNMSVAGHMNMKHSLGYVVVMVNIVKCGSAGQLNTDKGLWGGKEKTS